MRFWRSLLFPVLGMPFTVQMACRTAFEMAGTWIVRTRLWTFDDLSSMFAEMDPWGPALSRLTYSVSCLCSRRKARHSQPLGVLPDQVSALQIQGLVCRWIQAFCGCAQPPKFNNTNPQCACVSVMAKSLVWSALRLEHHSLLGPVVDTKGRYSAAENARLKWTRPLPPCPACLPQQGSRPPGPRSWQESQSLAAKSILYELKPGPAFRPKISPTCSCMYPC
jgi:hypothetical protein